MGVRRRKAVSPVIATLLLILIAVAAAILVYVWITGYTSAMAKTGAPELEEKLKIEAVSAKVGTSVTVTVYFRNIGNVEAIVDSVYIIRARDNYIVGYTTNQGITLAPGQLGSATISGVEEIQDGVTYIVKVVTKSGVEASLSFVARRA